MRAKFCVWSVCLAAMSSVHAQNRQPTPQDPIVGRVGLGFLSTSGNTDSTNANASFGLLYGRGDSIHSFDLSAVSAANSGTTTAEAYTSRYQFRHSFSERAYLFAGLDWNRDRFSAYERQMSESAGYGRRLIDRETHQLNVEVGGGARQSKLRDGTEQDEAILRSALGYRWIFSETTGFTQDLVVESGSSNTSVESISALRARVVGSIAMVLSYRVRYNTEVPVDIRDTDTFTSIALEYVF